MCAFEEKQFYCHTLCGSAKEEFFLSFLRTVFWIGLVPEQIQIQIQTCLETTLIMATHAAAKEGQVFIMKYKIYIVLSGLDCSKIGPIRKWIMQNSLTREFSSHVAGNSKFFPNIYKRKGYNLFLFSVQIVREQTFQYTPQLPEIYLKLGIARPLCFYCETEESYFLLQFQLFALCKKKIIEL